MMIKKSLKKAGILFTAVALLLTGCSNRTDAPMLKESVKGCVDFETIEIFDLQKTEWYDLTAVADTYEVITDNAGYFLSWNKIQGDTVKKGEVIATLEYKSTIKKVDKAVEVQGDDYEYNIQCAELDYKIEKAELEALKTAGVDNTSIRLQEINTELAKLEYDRLSNIAAKCGSARTVDETENEQEEEGKTGTFDLVAPVDGTVVFRGKFLPGDVVSEMSCLAAVASDEVVLKGSFISESALESIDRIYAYIDGVECNLKKLDYTAADYVEKCARFTADKLPAVGSDIGAFIVSNTVKDAFCVPVDALRVDRDGYFVMTLDEENKLRRKDVLIGSISNEYAEIIHGINVGDKVVVSETAQNLESTSGREVLKETFEAEGRYSATVVHLSSATLYFEEESLTFGRFLVNEGDYVTAGTVIAECEVNLSEDELKQMQKEAGRLKESVELKKSTHEAELASISKKYEAATEAEKKVYDLKRQKLELEYQNNIENLQKQIDSIENDIAVWEGEKSANCVVAPIDGVVDKLSYVKEGDLISNTRWIAKMHSDAEEYLQVTDTNKELNGLMKVTVQANGTEFYPATIVQADNLLNPNLSTGKALILLDDKNVRLSELKNTTVITKDIVIENVLTVPREAVLTAKGKKYVTVIVDGVGHKRYVTVGPSNDTVTCILYGIDEKDEVLVQ